MKSFITLSVILVFLTLIALTSWGNGKEAIDAKALFETKCSVCHSADRAKSTKRTREGWTKTVMKMKGRKEGIISNDDAGMIIDYLSINYGK